MNSGRGRAGGKRERERVEEKGRSNQNKNYFKFLFKDKLLIVLCIRDSAKLAACHSSRKNRKLWSFWLSFK